MGPVFAEKGIFFSWFRCCLQFIHPRSERHNILSKPDGSGDDVVKDKKFKEKRHEFKSHVDFLKWVETNYITSECDPKFFPRCFTIDADWEKFERRDPEPQEIFDDRWERVKADKSM